MKNIYKFLMSGCFLINLLMIMTSCSDKKETEDAVDHGHEEGLEMTEAQYKQAAIEIGKAEKRNMGSALKVNGVIDVPPHGEITISLPYGGFLKYTKMLPGTKVKKGQLLAIVENPDFIQFQQEYLENLSRRAFLKAEFERQEKLYKEQVAAGKKFQEAQSLYEANEIRIRAMGERLKLIGFNLNRINEGKTSAAVRIYSTIDGSVRDVYANIGKYIDPRDAIMMLTDTGDLHVELSVYENDIPKIKNGQKIKFTVSNSPEVMREAEVFLIGSGVREDRSVTVHGHLMKEEKGILPGMYVSANVIIGTNEVWTVPEESVVRFGGKQFVFVLKGKVQEGEVSMYQFEMKEVTKGNTENGFSEISYQSGSDNISADQIIVRGAYALLSLSKNTDAGHSH